MGFLRRGGCPLTQNSGLCAYHINGVRLIMPNQLHINTVLTVGERPSMIPQHFKRRGLAYGVNRKRLDFPVTYWMVTSGLNIFCVPERR